MENTESDYVKRSERDDSLSNWIAIKIEACQFEEFSKVNGFERPSDENALNLMNACAGTMLSQFPYIVFAYGARDEYSFLMEEKSEICESRSRQIMPSFVSYFTSAYIRKWNEFFPNKEMKGLPLFEANVFNYPTAKTTRDYLRWRQEDCQIKNQYDTCFWMLFKSGVTEKEAHLRVEGIKTEERNEMLFKDFGINYDQLPEMLKNGSCVYRKKVEKIVKDEHENPVKRALHIITLDHSEIIGPKFWDEHPYILQED